MDLTTEHLGRAQDEIQQAASRVSEVVHRITPGPGIGTQRLDYLTQAIAQLNSAWSLVRACVNDPASAPAVKQLPHRVPFKMSVINYHAASRRREKVKA